MAKQAVGNLKSTTWQSFDVILFLATGLWNFDKVVTQRGDASLIPLRGVFVPELLPGSILSHYRIVSKIGAGGMGEVYLAEDTVLDRKVALKILPQEYANDKNRMNRFMREAKSASALNHPNILTVHEFGFERRLHFLATEFVEGRTLREIIARGDLSLLDTLNVAEQATAALSAAHANGIVHRDVKPENFMIRPDGIVKILDFGLAKLIETESFVDPDAETLALVKTKPGVVVGTVNYMSPEQARGKETDGRTDIWSSGVVLFEMASGGNLPFAGETASDIVAAILRSEPLLVSHFVPDVPPELERIVGRCLRKNADDRYQSIKDLYIDLRDLRQELVFQAKVEHSTLPSKNRGQTSDILGAQKPTHEDGTATRISSSAESIFARNKGALVMAFASLIFAGILLGYWLHTRNKSTANQIESIAVLPFQNASGTTDTEYISDGVSEALINSLTEFQQLKVIARGTAFRYKGKEIDPQAVGRELKVRAVLMGRVRQVGDQLNIQVDLVDASTGAQLWGQEYQRRVEDVLTVKQAIAREVTEKLRLKLSGEQQQQLVKRDTTNAEAYQFYLHGRYHWNKRTAEGIRKAIEQFQQTIARDPNYALGHVGLADSLVLLSAYASVPSSETLPKAETAAARALQIDDSLAEAHTSMAQIHLRQWRWAEAEQRFRRAIALNPNYPTAHHWFSIFLRLKGQFDEALIESKRAEELDPLSLIIGNNLANAYFLKNDINSALEQLQTLIDLDPRFPGTHHNLGWLYQKLGRYDEAAAEFQRAVEFSGRASSYLSSLGYSYAVKGRRGEAIQILRELEDRYARREALGIELAGVTVGLGEIDQTFDWLEKDFEQGSGVLPEVRWWNNFAEIRLDPRYAKLLRRMGIQP